MCNGLQEMQRRIASLASYNSIKVLRVFGHGGPGWQNIAAGTRDSGRCGEESAIKSEALDRLAGLLFHFAPGARVELRGSSVSSDGGAMISALAQLWKVRVQAAKTDQEGLLSWNNVIEARPGMSGLFPVTPVPLEKGD